MSKKLIIFVIVVILLTIGGIILFSDETQEWEFSITPTEWSQEVDYQINETDEGIIVTNQKAGFSFKVPDGWSVQGETYNDDEYFVNLLNPSAKIGGSTESLLDGCGIGLSTLYQKDEVFFVENLILANQNILDALDDDEAIEISGYSALKTTLISEDPAVLEKFGAMIQVRIPFSKEGLIELGITMMPGFQSICTEDFNNFLLNFSID